MRWHHPQAAERTAPETYPRQVISRAPWVAPGKAIEDSVQVWQQLIVGDFGHVEHRLARQVPTVADGDWVVMVRVKYDSECWLYKNEMVTMMVTSNG